MVNQLNIPQVSAQQPNKSITFNDATEKLGDAFATWIVISVDNTNARTLTDTELTSNFLFTLAEGAPAPTGTITVTCSALQRGLFVVSNATSQTAIIEVTGQSPSPSLLTGENGLFIGTGSVILLITKFVP